MGRQAVRERVRAAVQWELFKMNNPWVKELAEKTETEKEEARADERRADFRDSKILQRQEGLGDN